MASNHVTVIQCLNTTSFVNTVIPALRVHCLLQLPIPFLPTYLRYSCNVIRWNFSSLPRCKNDKAQWSSIAVENRTKFICRKEVYWHYDDVRMGAIASQITSLTIVYSIVYSDADQRKHQSSASLAFVRGIHRGPVNFPHKWPVTRKMFPFDDVIMDLINSGYASPPCHYKELHLARIYLMNVDRLCFIVIFIFERVSSLFILTSTPKFTLFSHSRF